MTFAIAQAIEWFGNLFFALIIARALMSWLPASREGGLLGGIFYFLAIVTEPFVSPVRRLLNRSPLGGGGMMIDFAPMITLILMRLITLNLAAFIRTM